MRAGKLSFEEFTKLFPKMDVSTRKQMFTLMDTDHDGSVDFNEFLIKMALLNERIEVQAVGTRPSFCVLLACTNHS